MSNLQKTFNNFILGVMAINIKMLGSLMKNWVSYYMSCGLIIIMHDNMQCRGM